MSILTKSTHQVYPIKITFDANEKLVTAIDVLRTKLGLRSRSIIVQKVLEELICDQ